MVTDHDYSFRSLREGLFPQDSFKSLGSVVLPWMSSIGSFFGELVFFSESINVA